MNILICAADPADRKLAAFAARSFPADAPPEILSDPAFSRSYRKKAQGAFVYFDAALGSDRVRELASRLDEVEDCGWGILDRKGESMDPAAWFFAGASDYVGPSLYKAGIGPERLEEALVYADLEYDEADAPTPSGGSSFPGWSALAEGADVPVRFCYAAVGNQKSLLERIGEKRLDRLREEFATFLDSWFKDSGGIVWIRETAGCLLLFPPQDVGMNPIMSAFRLLLDRALIGYEVFKLEVPLSFRFAFHAGRTMWQRPGATGKIVSEDVNFVFHLGTKAAGDGYVLVSSEAASDIPASLRDLFTGAGDYEGRSLIASKTFKDSSES
jgi:hypothetical protein